MSNYLIIEGSDICHNALNEFAHAFAAGLKKLGEQVDLKHFEHIDDDIISELLSNNYKAILGFQTNFFRYTLPDGRLLGNVFDMPKFNMIFDPPSHLYDILSTPIDNMNYLEQDEQYADFIREYYHNVNTYNFPAAGSRHECFDGNVYNERFYDLSFVGTYDDYRYFLNNTGIENPGVLKLTLGYFEYMLLHPNENSQQAFLNYTKESGLEFKGDEALVIMKYIHYAERAVIAYYREKTVETLLNNGITLDVFSETWNNAPFANNENLRIHNSISYKEGLRIMSQSRLSLNVMSWHKGGMTERVANIMLNGAVCVTDETSYIKRNFIDGENIILFKLENINEVAYRIKELIINDKKRLEIAKNGYELAAKAHTWDKRAEEFLELL